MTQKRNRREGVEDHWMKKVRGPDGSVRSVPSAAHGKGSRYRARYVDNDNREHSKAFALKRDAQNGSTQRSPRSSRQGPTSSHQPVASQCPRSTNLGPRHNRMSRPKLKQLVGVRGAAMSNRSGPAPSSLTFAPPLSAHGSRRCMTKAPAPQLSRTPLESCAR